MNPFSKTTLKIFGLFGILTMVACEKQKEDTSITSSESITQKAVDLPTAAANSATLVPESVLNAASTPSDEEIAAQNAFTVRSKKKGGAEVYAYLYVGSLGNDKGCSLEPYGEVTSKLVGKNYKDCYKTDYLAKRYAKDPYFIKKGCYETLKCVKYSENDTKHKYLKLSGCLQESDCNKDDGAAHKSDDYLGDKSDCIDLNCKPGCYTVWQCYEKAGQKVYAKYVVYVR